MFGSGRDDMISLGPIHGGDAFEGQIIAFGGAAGEDDFARMSTDQVGYLLPGLLDGLIGFLTETMGQAGGVAVTLSEVGQHRLDHTRVGSCCGIVIQIHFIPTYAGNRIRMWSRRCYPTLRHVSWPLSPRGDTLLFLFYRLRKMRNSRSCLSSLPHQSKVVPKGGSAIPALALPPFLALPPLMRTMRKRKRQRLCRR